MSTIPHITPEDVLLEVSKAYGVPVSDILGKSRKAPIVRARHVAMWITHWQCGWSLPKTAKHIGRQHHTTVLNACRRIDALIAARDINTMKVIRDALHSLWDVHYRCEKAAKTIQFGMQPLAFTSKHMRPRVEAKEAAQ